MSTIPPIESGSDLHWEWLDNQEDAPKGAPALPRLWTATVLLSPFGDWISPLDNYSQLVVGSIESSWTESESWLRARLYLTQDLTYFDFVFMGRIQDGIDKFQWYWIDSTPQQTVNEVYGPFQTTLQVPPPEFFRNSQWGNSYPLMCTDTHPEGIDCDHWTDLHSWYAFRGYNIFRILTMDSANPQRLPILGSYYIANIPTFTRHAVSDSSKQLIYRIKRGPVRAKPDYWNPMVTQQDIHRALAHPLATSNCTPEEIQTVLPGFIVKKAGVPLPRWSDRTYIEGWTLANDVVPYRTRVCYRWTGEDDSHQETFLISPGEKGIYLGRMDAYLYRGQGTWLRGYDWETDHWEAKNPAQYANPFGPPRPDWVAHGGGEVMGQIAENPDFGLASDEVLRLTATPEPEGGGLRPLFWAWFLQNDVGMLFSEGTYVNSLDHLQLIDYKLFMRNAPLPDRDLISRSLERATTGLGVDAGNGDSMRRTHRVRISSRTRFLSTR